MVLPPAASARKVRKHLSADALYALIRKGFGAIPDHRQLTSIIPLTDALMSAFALATRRSPRSFHVRWKSLAGIPCPSSPWNGKPASTIAQNP